MLELFNQLRHLGRWVIISTSQIIGDYTNADEAETEFNVYKDQEGYSLLPPIFPPQKPTSQENPF